MARTSGIDRARERHAGDRECLLARRERIRTVHIVEREVSDPRARPSHEKNAFHYCERAELHAHAAPRMNSAAVFDHLEKLQCAHAHTMFSIPLLPPRVSGVMCSSW